MKLKLLKKGIIYFSIAAFSFMSLQSENAFADELGAYVGSDANDIIHIRKDDEDNVNTESEKTNKEVKYGPKKGKKISDGVLNFKITKRANTGTFGEGSVEVIRLKKKSVRKVVIKDTVKIDGFKYFVRSIGKNTFKNNKKIRQVRIKSVYLKKIGAKAFYNCKKLKKVYIYSLVSLRYGKKAFYKKGNSKMTIIYSSECIKNMKLLLKKAKCKGYRYTIKKLM